MKIDKIFTYHVPTTESIRRLKLLRDSAKTFVQIIEELVPDSSDKSAAVRKLRECVMTANAAIVLNQSTEEK